MPALAKTGVFRDREFDPQTVVIGNMKLCVDSVEDFWPWLYCVLMHLGYWIPNVRDLSRMSNSALYLPETRMVPGRNRRYGGPLNPGFLLQLIPFCRHLWAPPSLSSFLRFSHRWPSSWVRLHVNESPALSGSGSTEAVSHLRMPSRQSHLPTWTWRHKLTIFTPQNIHQVTGK